MRRRQDVDGERGLRAGLDKGSEVKYAPDKRAFDVAGLVAVDEDLGGMSLYREDSARSAGRRARAGR